MENYLMNRDFMDSDFAIGRWVLVRGLEEEGARRIYDHIDSITGGVRLDEEVVGFRSWNVEDLVAVEPATIVRLYMEVS